MKLIQDKHITRPANRLFDLYTGGQRRPVFFDVEQTFPALRAVQESYPVIREEFERVIEQRESIPRYHDLDANQAYVSAVGEPSRSWRVFMLYAMGLKPEENRRACPRTCTLLETIPNLFQSFFSILEPRKSVPAHSGPYRGYLRYHLGLRVPRDRPPRIRIKDQFYTWQEGQGVLFDDSWNHEVFNDSDELRAVLVVDVMRPMPWLFHQLNRWVTNVYLQGYRDKLQENLAALGAGKHQSIPFGQ